MRIAHADREKRIEPIFADQAIASGRLAMLVLSRKEGERLMVGDQIVVTVTRISGNRVTLGIEAPREVRIVRGELEPRPAFEVLETELDVDHGAVVVG
jgi:carbon storage regulator